MCHGGDFMALIFHSYMTLFMGDKLYVSKLVKVIYKYTKADIADFNPKDYPKG